LFQPLAQAAALDAAQQVTKVQNDAFFFFFFIEALKINRV